MTVLKDAASQRPFTEHVVPTVSCMITTKQGPWPGSYHDSVDAKWGVNSRAMESNYDVISKALRSTTKLGY